MQLYLGNSGSGKSYQLYQKIIMWSLEEPDTHFLIIVPEQFTLQTQKDIVTMHPRHGTMNIDILSFERLAYRVFEEVGVLQTPVMDEIGKNLILRKVAEDKKKDLLLLGSNLKKLGTISEMKSMLSELMQYNIHAEELDRMVSLTEENPTLQYKLKDIRVLQDGFSAYICDHYITTEEIYERLSHVIKDSELVRGSVIAMDGFTGFTPVQNQLLLSLFQMAKKVMVTVTLDDREDPYRLGKEHQLFYMSKEMIASLQSIAGEAKIEREQDVVLKSTTGRHAKSPALAHLERNIFRYPMKTYGAEQEEIQVFTAKNPYQEMIAVAIQIRKLIKEGYRYQDIAVISGATEQYNHYASKVFEDYKIPTFLDNKRSILQNPFIEMIRASLKMIEDNFSYESVFRYLRSGLSDLKKEEIDRLENYVLALGIRGRKKWKEKWLRKQKGMSEEELQEVNRIRMQFMESCTPLIEGTKEKEATARNLSTALYKFIVCTQCKEKLADFEAEFLAEGADSLAKEYAQIYGIVMELLDKIVELLGDEPLSKKEYREILDAGLEEAKVGTIPPTLDRVVVGDVERTRLSHIKVLFFVGVNDGIIPKATGQGGILSQLERETLHSKKFVLAPTARQNSYIQKFYLYLNLTKPEEKLYLSYAKTDADGKAIRTSYLIGTILKMFEQITILDTESKQEETESLATPQSAFSFLAKGLRASLLGNETKGFLEVYRWFFEQPAFEKRVQQLIKAAFLENQESKISKAVAKALYGTELVNNVTRLEQYAACAFAHFAHYGLGLEERQEYEFGSADMGNIFHQALERFSQKLEHSTYTWFDLTDEVREELVDTSVEECIIDYGNTVLYRSYRDQYQIARMKRILQRTVWALQEQVKRGRFQPSRYEVSFSTVEELEAVQISLSEGEKMKIRGRIDRLDLYEDEENVYVKVIDYKSGNTQFDLMAVYYGLQLQLVVYLNAALEMEQKRHPDKAVIPAGILYYNMKDPIVDAENEEDAESIKAQILEELRMGGLVNADLDIIKAMDGSFDKKSAVIPVTLNKDGSLSRYSQAATKEQFSALSSYVRGKMKELGKEILAGNISVLPYEANGRTACDYCELRGVCGFDLKTPGYHYNRLAGLENEEIWARFSGKEEA